MGGGSACGGAGAMNARTRSRAAARDSLGFYLEELEKHLLGDISTHRHLLVQESMERRGLYRLVLYDTETSETRILSKWMKKNTLTTTLDTLLRILEICER